MTQIDRILPKEKVMVYVLRKVEGKVEILVFDHADFPDVDRQVPGGGVNPTEKPEHAAIRELEEESGITNARLIRYLGSLSYDNPYTREEQRRNFFLVQAPASLPGNWDHIVDSRDSDNGLVFSFYWRKLQEADLGYDQGKGLQFILSEDLDRLRVDE